MTSSEGLMRIILLAVAGVAGCTISLVDQDDDAVHDCGNGVLDAGEICDDGNTEGGDGCSPTCDSNELCGNGYLDVALGEQCDAGGFGNTATCDVDCTLPLCGDGLENPAAGERCDDGNTVSADGCRADCVSDETCGNAVVDNHLPHNGSNNPALCLDAISQGTGCAEVCDDGNHVSGDGCSANCLSEEVCGNGIRDEQGNGSNNPPEQCDDGNHVDTDACPNDCVGHALACGNGVVDPGEQCDTFDESAACDADCTFAVCGDNHRNPHAGEQCDPGVVGGFTPGCDRDCTLPICGDNVVNAPAGEQCDPGAVGVNTATCDNECTLALCGDGHVNPAAGEQCDDGNNVDGDACRNNCTLP